MNIWPAIDIIDGKCVRLTAGDYAQKKVYSNDPVIVAKQFQNARMQHLHIVDLDGAKSGKPENLKLIKDIVQNVDLKIEVGGGIRDMETAKIYLDSGVDRVILGSQAIKNPAFLQKCLDTFGLERIVLGLDMKGGRIAISGWLEMDDRTAEDFLSALNFRPQHILVTDISKDGRLEGPNFSLYKTLMHTFPDLNFIASGGVSSIEDIQTLKDIDIQDIIVGKAVYEEKINLRTVSSLSTNHHDESD